MSTIIEKEALLKLETVAVGVLSSGDDNFLDLLEAGKVHAHAIPIARLPNGTTLDMRMWIYKGIQPGPVILVSGGLHGDEVNGIEIVRRLTAEEDLLLPERGTVIAIPVLNLYGFLNFNRELPDGKDANRSFPGTATGSLASRVAYFVRTKVLPFIDYGIDFHTGGASRANAPQVRCDFSDNEAYELGMAFNAPLLVHSGLITGSLRHTAMILGKPTIVFEGGQSLRFDAEVITQGMDGVLRVLTHLKMRDYGQPQVPPPIIIHRTTWVRADTAGLFDAQVMLGSPLQIKDIIGQLADPYNDNISTVYSPAEGYIIGLNYSPVVYAGDALLHLGHANVPEDCDDEMIAPTELKAKVQKEE